MKATGMGNRAVISREHRMGEQQPVEAGNISQPRKIYTISVGYHEVRNVSIVATSDDEAMAMAKEDWSMDRNLKWRDCPSFEEPFFQIEDEKEEGCAHEPV